MSFVRDSGSNHIVKIAICLYVKIFQSILISFVILQKKKKASSGISEFSKPDEDQDLITEHGVLFECSPDNWTDQKKPPPTMSYWVVG